MKKHIQYHKDGSVWGKGFMSGAKGDIMDGYWEWLRKDGTKMRSGNFNKGVQIGEWITYDTKGKPHKTTIIKDKKNPRKTLKTKGVSSKK